MPLLDWLPDRMAWTPCPPVATEAECATLDTPLDPLDPASDTLSLALARIPAREPPARGQLWIVSGFPGDSGTSAFVDLTAVADLAPDLDIVTLDHRGTGYSGRLSCPLEESAASPGGSAITPGEWESCIAGLGTLGEDHLVDLTVTGAAFDLALTSIAAAAPEQEIYWWGTSYGTYLVQRALHIAPSLPAGVILDDLMPTDWRFDEFDRGFDAVARQLLVACELDEDCASHFDTSPTATAEAVLAGLAPRCAELGLDDDTVRRLTGALLLPGEPYASLVPAIWRRLERCDARDRRALAHLLDVLRPTEPPEPGTLGALLAEGASPVLHRHLVYAELWDHRGPDAASYASALEDTLSTTAMTADLAEQVAAWPVHPPEDEWRWRWPETQVPVLAVHGGLDPTMPTARIGGFDRWLVGPGQAVVRVPFADRLSVDVVLRDGCLSSMHGAFLSDPTAEVDASCVAEMPSYAWDGDPALDESLLGDPDRWGEARGCGCAAPGLPGPAWLASLAGFAVLRRGPRRSRGRRDTAPLREARWASAHASVGD